MYKMMLCGLLFFLGCCVQSQVVAKPLLINQATQSSSMHMPMISGLKDKLTSILPPICLAQNTISDTLTTFDNTKSNTLASNVLDEHFPYGIAPKNDVCVTSDYYATPEGLLGSWAMTDAVNRDVQNNILPAFLNNTNMVYAIGTAAIGNLLGVSNCEGGCNDLNGYCFALKFNDKPNYPYMIFQSVNIGANANSFDIYMAGGGSGAFPEQCAQFWGTNTSVNWENNIENAASCDAYFNHYDTINSKYAVTYNGIVHSAKQTLMDACTYASANFTGFNTQNWRNVTVVPVTCPLSLIEVTGVEIPATITTVGNKTIISLSALKESDFQTSTITNVTTTQMQDCKTPSSGYCGNVSKSVVNHQASISANLTEPMLKGSGPTGNYCQKNPAVSGFCSWNDGQSSGSDYCNQSQSICMSCGNRAKWCVCNNATIEACQS